MFVSIKRLVTFYEMEVLVWLYSFPGNVLPCITEQMSSCFLVLGQTLVTRGLTWRERWAGGSCFQPPPPPPLDTVKCCIIISQMVATKLHCFCSALLTDLPFPCDNTTRRGGVAIMNPICNSGTKKDVPDQLFFRNQPYCKFVIPVVLKRDILQHGSVSHKINRF